MHKFSNFTMCSTLQLQEMVIMINYTYGKLSIGAWVHYVTLVQLVLRFPQGASTWTFSCKGEWVNVVMQRATIDDWLYKMGIIYAYQLPHSATTLTLGRREGSKARNWSSDFERTWVVDILKVRCSRQIKLNKRIHKPLLRWSRPQVPWH